MSRDVIIVGAGAAGLLAASCAAQRGRRVLLLEKNRKPGVKILMSGGTRCNLTHATDRRGIVEAFGRRQGPFLHSALAALGPQELVQLFADAGVPTKVEATGKVFPTSDKALDVLQALLRRVHESGAELALAEPVRSVERTDTGFVLQTDGRELASTSLILTTGGQSYPGCGTTGDGYDWVRRWGHTIVPPRPALVPLRSSSTWVTELMGVTVTDVRVRLYDPDAASRVLDERRGSFLFTHFGLSGPVVMDISRLVTEYAENTEFQLGCDFLPEAGAEQLAARLKAADGKSPVARVVSDWLPRRLGDALLQLAKVPAERKMAELSRAERAALLQTLKDARVAIRGTLGFKKAEVTAGGVALKEVDSRTMQSKRVPGLYLAGEVLDLDGPIGGYNFQAAFSTGWLAGQNA
jgi:predicted Rossmann fold flavoprotein